MLAVLEILKIRQRSLIGASEPTEAPRNTLMTDKSRLDVDPLLHLTLRQFKGIEIRDKCFFRANKYPFLIFISHLESSIRVWNWIYFSTSTGRVKEVSYILFPKLRYKSNLCVSIRLFVACVSLSSF